MTNTEERLYLETLLLESSRWRISEDDPYSPIEREILDRLRRLNGIETIDENGYAQSDVPDNPVDEPLTGADYQALEAAKLNEHLANRNKSNARENWKADKVRCQENGKVVWHPVSECHQEKLFPNNPKAKKFRWVWDGPQDKKAQEDAMWEAHERTR